MKEKITKTAVFSIILFLLLCCELFGKPYIVSSDNLGIDTSWARFDVRIGINKKCYQSGESFIAKITPNRDCYILVYYTNENGSCLIIYPNTYESRDYLKAGESFSIGDNPEIFSINVDTQKTRDYLQVIATDEPINTSTLEGINSPAMFVDKIRLILKERVEERARKLRKTTDVPLENKVFAIGTVDYLCNYPSYFPPSEPEKPTVPVIKKNDTPLIEVRTVERAAAKNIRIVGPDAPKTFSPPTSGNVYSIKDSMALLSGTVSYSYGIKSILINGERPTFRKIGDSKGLTISEAEDEILKIIDFSYTIKNLTAAPRVITIVAEGTDGKKSSFSIKIKRE